MSTPQIYGIDLNATPGDHGFDPGQIIQATVRYGDADTIPEKPAIEDVSTQQVTRDGRIGTRTITDRYSTVPVVSDIDLSTPTLTFDDGRPVTRVSAEHDRAVFRFAASSSGSARALVKDKAGQVATHTSAPLPVSTRPPFARKPGVIIYDSWPAATDACPPELSANTGGIDALMRRALGTTQPVNGGYRNYLNIRDAKWVKSPMSRTTTELSRRSLICISFGDTREERYSTDTYNRIARGDFDDDIRAVMRSRPIGVNRPIGEPIFRFYDAFIHEPDIYSAAGTDATAYIRGIRRAMSVAIHEAQLMGATPEEYGCGGLLSGMDAGAANPYHWYVGLPKWMHDSGMVVGFWDKYFKVKLVDAKFQPEFQAPGTDGKVYGYEPFRTKIDEHVATLRSYGINRFVIGETALGLDTRANPGPIVGTVHHTRAWLKEALAWSREVGEILSFFSIETGVMSSTGSFTRPGFEAALKDVAIHCAAVNR